MSHLILFSLASLIAIIYAIGQRNIYRIISFVFISQLSLALFAFSIKDLLGYLYVLSILPPILALIVISYVIAVTSGAEIDRVEGLLSRMPVSTWTFITASIMISLFPPFMPFILEHFIIEESLLLGQIAAATVIVLVLIRVLTIVCLFKVSHKIFFGTPSKLEVEEPKVAYLALILVLLSILLTFNPYFWNMTVSLGVSG